MAELTFKSFRELNEYLIENEMLDLEELTDTILQGTEEEEED
jgi:hypothetical protein